MKLGMDRHNPRLGSLGPPHIDRRQTGVQRQVAHLECQGFGYPESSLPLYQE